MYANRYNLFELEKLADNHLYKTKRIPDEREKFSDDDCEAENIKLDKTTTERSKYTITAVTRYDGRLMHAIVQEDRLVVRMNHEEYYLEWKGSDCITYLAFSEQDELPDTLWLLACTPFTAYLMPVMDMIMNICGTRYGCTSDFMFGTVEEVISSATNN